MDVTTHPSDENTSDAAAGTAVGAQSASDVLVDAALACVRWDESVDLDRLMVLEFEYNFNLLMPAVSKAAHRFDGRKSRLGQGYILQRTETVHFPWLHNNQHGTWGNGYSVALYRCDRGMWSVEHNGESMSDAQLAAWLAICARLPAFSFRYPVCDGDVDPDGTLRFGAYDMPSFKDMWMVSVVEAIAVRSGAWTGAEIMRTRNLCIALSAILDARQKNGPLIAVDIPKSGILTQAIAPALLPFGSGDGAILSSMRDALGAAESLTRGIHEIDAASTTMRKAADTSIVAQCIRKTLDIVYRMVDRLYATETYFLKLIAPSEYEAMIAEAPLAATFFQ
ncbi:hypothetical protein pqer_cds_1005 [Pandoravirus quercus]|uniref:Uncharacterized protein n=1 Tax=Pandoravirus quercus TaxID=2107709 RepID=A0A2U7UAF4_9VIRU|nr:hypothetical protein pqer_cds_1005 [Pandoravirus quercus]AVK75427.1 hypothetical protein pqer_cds_1005 [Pandoravirus quercus]